RGREGQRQLTRSSFKCEVDASGRSFLTMAHDEVSKNHPGGLKDVTSVEKYARIYETDQENDGYKAMKLYLSKLNPESEAFFQYPKNKNWAPNNPIWMVAMFHSRTSPKIQDHILDSLKDPHGKVKVVIATSALGMG
ncbi:hypothetical protein QZH41_010469, partial [Actinostola sp. cb2023]